MSAALAHSVVPLHRDDIFVSRLASGNAPLPQAIIDLFLAHRRGKPWKETASCTSCKRIVITTMATEAGGKCGYCRSGRIVQMWDSYKAQATLAECVSKTDGSGICVAWGHVRSPQPVLIGFLQVSVVSIAGLTRHTGHEMRNEIAMFTGRHDFYAVIDNLVVADPSHDDVTALTLLDAAIKQLDSQNLKFPDAPRMPMLVLVGNGTLYETVFAQRNFRLFKSLTDHVLCMGRVL